MTHRSDLENVQHLVQLELDALVRVSFKAPLEPQDDTALCAEVSTILYAQDDVLSRLQASHRHSR